MAAFLDVVGYPAGATVFIDGIEVGITPIYYKMLKTGKYKIEVHKVGYLPEIREEFTIYSTERKKVMVYNLSKSEGMIIEEVTE